MHKRTILNLCGANAKDLINQNLDDYHEILHPRTVLDILGSKYMVEVTRIINSGHYTRVGNQSMALLAA